jgi:hypothetical protein
MVQENDISTAGAGNDTEAANATEAGVVLVEIEETRNSGVPRGVLCRQTRAP